MKNLRPETLSILDRVESLSGKPVVLKPDATLSLSSALQFARDGAKEHVLVYRPDAEPADYRVAHQAGFALRLFGLPAADRLQFDGSSAAAKEAAELMSAGQPLGPADKSVIGPFADGVAKWALINLRSYPIGMRVDAWLWREYPALRPAIVAGLAVVHAENLRLLSQRLGNLHIPVTLFGPVVAAALFGDRLTGSNSSLIPYRASGMLDHGQELLAIFDALPDDPATDRQLVDAWAQASGMVGWYRWSHFKTEDA